MNTIKNYKVLAVASLRRTKIRDEFISHYEIDNVSATDNKVYFDFCDEKTSKLNVLLKEFDINTSENGVGKNLMKRIRKLYKETFTTKKDWLYAVGVCPDTDQVTVWLTNLTYMPFKKVVVGEVVLFRLEEKDKQQEWSRYEHTIQDYKRKTVGDKVYYDSTGRLEKYHDFRKANGNKTFVQNLELIGTGKKGMRKLKKDASLEENTKHNNELAQAYNKQQAVLDSAVSRIEELEQELKALKKCS